MALDLAQVTLPKDSDAEGQIVKEEGAHGLDKHIMVRVPVEIK
jgi:hypothetical protein